MKHSSVLKLNSPIEFIESTKISPFISKVQIKVCYVSDEPNRNRSIITKNVAKDMAPSLRGCPIVGFYNESDKDFEEHNRQINISNGEWRITDTTIPYGFVPTDAKLWFATYIDDEEVEHEYLCTEGYMWDHVYPEAQRVKEQGNNQSMELDEDTLDATWSKDKKGNPEFFIINEALISKLCILGEKCEPCFEGSQITAFSLVIDESFQNKMFAMMNELKELITEGGAKVFNTYAVEIGDALWSAIHQYLVSKYPDENDRWCSKYAIDGIYEESGGQKFVILYDGAEAKYYRLNFSISEADGFKADEDLVEVTKTYTPAVEPQFSAEAVAAYNAEYAKKKDEEEKNQDKNGEEEEKKSEDNAEGEKKSEEDKDKDEEDKKKKKFSYDTLEEIPEYVELQTKFAELETRVASLNSTIESLNSEIAPLREFKNKSEREAKEAKIAEFYMLSDEDKKDVVDNIDTYSLDDIEAKLSVICFRNKVSFTSDNKQGETTYIISGDEDKDCSTPAWVKAVLETLKNKN